MQSMPNELVGKPDGQEPSRKPYRTPTLTVYGTVEQITLNVGLNPGDGLVGSVLV